jgi:phage shock protein A
MNLFTRITATLSGKVDDLVSHVENHDAIVEVALKDTRAALAKARVRLARVQKDGEALHHRLSEAQRMESVWTERAKATAAADEKKALECVGRRNQCREQATQTAEALARHEELERTIGSSVERMEQRLSELSQQRNMLRSRHSAADALRVINRIEGSSAHGIEDTFDRWEMLITETEYSNGNLPYTDTLDADFRSVEDASALRADLAALLTDDGANNASHKE